MSGLGTLLKRILSCIAIGLVVLMALVILLRNTVGGPEMVYLSLAALFLSVAALLFFFIAKLKVRREGILRAQFSGSICAILAITYTARMLL